MFSSSVTPKIAPSSAASNEATVQNTIDSMFNILNPLTVQKDTDITTPLKQLAGAKRDIQEQYINGLKDKLSNLACADLEFIKNDLSLLNSLLDGIHDFRLNLNESIREQTIGAIQIGLTSFSASDFSIADESNHGREPINFNRLLPEIGLAAQNFGHLGRKIILEGTKQILQGDKKMERFDKCVKVIFDKEPSNEAVLTQTQDYYMHYDKEYGDSLDEPYHEPKSNN